MESVFFRKITKSKWNNQLQSDEKLHNIISADAVTSCLRTSSNQLSVWKVAKIDDAILALAVVADTIVSIDIVSIKETFFHSRSLIVQQSIAESNPVKTLREYHYNIEELNYDSLGIVSKELASKISQNKDYIVRYTVKQIKQIIKDALDAKKLILTDLKPELQEKILQDSFFKS